ncbi:hypothetical protein CRUP_033146 [Coryphaenoides rupestris]|nr:hypothetical protein CRUP_033146 [Coryphaenoides rupestris]
MGQQRLMGSACRCQNRWGADQVGAAVGPGRDVIAVRRFGFRTKHRLGRWLGGLSQYFLVRCFKHGQAGLDSPRLSAASIGSTERAPSATPSDGSDPPSANQRPLSLVSTLSSGSASSRDDCQAPPPTGTSSPAPSGEDIDLEPIREHVRKGRGFHGERNNNNNSNGSASSPSRNAFRRQPRAATPGGNMAPGPPPSYVDRVVMEIIETERMYVRDLRMIVEDYLAHIIDHADLSVGPELVCALFGNIEDIYEFNSSVAALTECMRNKALAKFFRERQASLKRSLPLGSYLLKPVQRILKYHLLLQEIAKHSDQQGADYEVVEEAIYTMTGVAWYINDMKRRHEHAVRLQEVQSLLLHWKGPDLTTYGELVLEGTFKVHRAKNERTLFLFDRMLLITKRRGEHYVFKAHISARNLEEKKLWSHHIKRIILENHQAIIPQKAKEAILEMDSIYPSKYRYSPDRLKKALSVQSDEVPPESCQGRRQSAALKHAASEGAVPREEAPISRRSSSLLGFGPGEEEEEEEEEQERVGRKGSVDRLSGGVDPEEVDSDDDDDDMLLTLEGYQVADFASSMLAAISCWHSRARALLSLGDATDEEMRSLVQDEHLQRPPVVEGPPTELQKPASEPAAPAAAEPPAVEEPPSSSAATTQDSDSKTLSSEESSEEEESEEAGKETKATSILPSSVLSRAGAIAQHFTGSVRRPSLASDDASSPGCLSPRLLNRAGGALSPGLDGPEVFRPADANLLLSPRDSDDGVMGSGAGSRQRKDSTLSRHDQLLIGRLRATTRWPRARTRRSACGGARA